MSTDSDLQDMLLDGELRISSLESDICDLRDENKRLKAKIAELEEENKTFCKFNKLFKQDCRQAEERGARKILELLAKVGINGHYLSTQGINHLMKLWSEEKK